VGAAVEIAGMGGGRHIATDNVVRGNTIERGYEGIGLYGESSVSTVENNIVFNCQTYHIYLSRTRSNVVRNNLVYSNGSPRHGTSRGAGIVLSVETQTYTASVLLGDNKIYSNYIAGNAWGIFLNIDPGSDYGRVGERIYNNRIVDCSQNFRFERDDSKWEDNLIYDNLSFQNDPGTVGARVHTSKCNPIGVTWDENWYTSTGNFAAMGFLTDVDGNCSDPQPPSGTGNPRWLTRLLLRTVIDFRNLDYRTLNWHDKTMPPSIFLYQGETTPTCETDSYVCASESDCTTYHPTYYWCATQTPKCSAFACEGATCEVDAALCTSEADCLTEHPTYYWWAHIGECRPNPYTPTEVDGYTRAPMRPISTYPPVFVGKTEPPPPIVEEEEPE
jgi:parallel beta-helix repeat protein